MGQKLGSNSGDDDETIVVGMVVDEGHGGEKGRGKREKLQKQGKMTGFWPTLDPIFFSLRLSNPPLFIGGGRGKSCLHWKKNSALDSVEKDTNCWFKVDMVHCQFCSCRLPELGHLGWCHICLFASELVTTIPRRRGLSGD